MNQAERARKMDAIRYQVDTPRVTTMGACANACGRTARGASVCADCIAGSDPYLVAYVGQLRAHVRAKWDREQ